MPKTEGLWKLNPSALYTYNDCKACFWIEQHVGRPPLKPLRLNDAMDTKLKARFDYFRKLGELPPEIKDDLSGYHLFKDQEKLDEWRNWRRGLCYENKQDGYFLTGAVDEILIAPNKKLVSSDYKSSGDPPKADKNKYYILQIHSYALMLCENDRTVDGEGILFYYFPKKRNSKALYMTLACTVSKVPLHMRSFREQLRDMVHLLEKSYPGHNPTCKTCQYRQSTLLIKSISDEVNA